MNVGLALVQVLGLLQAIPGAMEKALNKNGVWATVALTNIGPALANCQFPRREGRLQVGNIEVDNVELLPPLRPFQCLNFGICTYGQRLTVAIYNARVLTGDAARGVLNTYIQHIIEPASLADGRSASYEKHLPSAEPVI